MSWIACKIMSGAARLCFEFHQRILPASGNQAMVSILRASAEVFLDRQKLPFIRRERAMQTWQEHRKILRALARRACTAAQQTAQEHVRDAALHTGIAFVTPVTP